METYEYTPPTKKGETPEVKSDGLKDDPIKSSRQHMKDPGLNESRKRYLRKIVALKTESIIERERTRDLLPIVITIAVSVTIFLVGYLLVKPIVESALTQIQTDQGVMPPDNIPDIWSIIVMSFPIVMFIWIALSFSRERDYEW